ncbi:hypothetical protein YC2023_060129 [Brassica napus]
MRTTKTNVRKRIHQDPKQMRMARTTSPSHEEPSTIEAGKTHRQHPIFENVSLVVVNMNNGTKKVIHTIKVLLFLKYTEIKYGNRLKESYRLHGNGIGSLWKREAKYFKKLGSGVITLEPPLMLILKSVFFVSVKDTRAKTYCNLYIHIMATKKSNEGECQQQEKCAGKSPEWICKGRFISLNYKLGGIRLRHANDCLHLLLASACSHFRLKSLKRNDAEKTKLNRHAFNCVDRYSHWCRSTPNLYKLNRCEFSEFQEIAVWSKSFQYLLKCVSRILDLIKLKHTH